MRNKYEAPEVLEVGCAEELILGVKQQGGFIDNEGVVGYYNRVLDDED